MHPSRRPLAGLLAAAAVVAAVAVGTPVSAQTYPDRPIRLVVPFAPGGSTDLITRYVADPLRQVLKQPVIVDNKAGAGGMLGTAEVARAAPDGYTLAVGTVSTMVIFPAAHPKPGYTSSSSRR